jgi:tetratricopeptide (TPR) repeat protein
MFLNRRANIVFLFALSFAVYANALANAFVSIDALQVLDNQWLRDWSSLREIFFSPVWAFDEGRKLDATNFQFNYYRPAMHLVFLAVYQAVGAKAWAFHLVSVAFHALSTVLVYMVARAALQDGFGNEPGQAGRVSFAAALLFAAHPVHVEAVAWISALPELAFTLFALLSIFLYVSRDALSAARLSASAFFFALALLSKETAMVVPMVLIAYDALSAGRLRPRRYVLFAAVAAVYALLRILVLGSFIPSKTSAGGDAFYAVLNAAATFKNYMMILAWPANLSYSHVFKPLTVILSGAFAWTAVCAAAVAAIIVYMRKDRAALFFALMGFVALLPAIYLALKVYGLREWTAGFAERYMYMPSAGLLVFVALFAERALKGLDSRIRERILLACVVAAAIALSVGTIKRNAVWNNDYVLFKNALENGGASPRIYLEFAEAARKAEFFDEAEKAHVEAVKLDPDSATVHARYAAFLFGRRDAKKAAEHYGLALSYADKDNAYVIYELNRDLGNALLAAGQTGEAIDAYGRALAIRPGDAQTHNRIGIARAEAGDVKGAIESFSKAVSLKPDYEDAKANLARARGMR